MPDTVAVPILVPPVAQLVGAVDCGPNRVKVMVPDGAIPEPIAELIEVDAIAVPALPVDGPVTESAGLALEMDSVCPAEVSEPEAAVTFGLPAWVSP